MEEIEGENVESVSIVEDLDIWPEIVGIKDKKSEREGELNKMNYYK